MYTEHCVKFWESGFELAENIKPKLQQRHLFPDLTIIHPCSWCNISEAGIIGFQDAQSLKAFPLTLATTQHP
jgi:hypothetical protein